MKDSGQSMVELGVSFVFLMYLLSGAVEFGIVFFQYVQLRDAAQEGALFGSANLPLDTESLEERVRGASSNPIDLQNSDVGISILVNDGAKTLEQACEGDGLKVIVDYEHKIFMPFLPKLIGQDTIKLSGYVTNTVLRPVCQ